MKVRILLFAAMKEAIGRGEIELEVREGASVQDAVSALVDLHPPLAKTQPFAAAVNEAYAPLEATLSEGDRLALIPPVSGG